MANFYQQIVYWIDLGLVKKIITVVALAAITVVYSFYHGYKRYNGPGHEDVIEMAVLGKQLSEGKGFSTLVVYPQTVAILESKHDDYIFKENQLHPELYQAPLYPLILATGLKVMGKSYRRNVWKDPVSEARGVYPAFNGDYYLIIVNVIIFWLVCLLTYFLGCLLFAPTVGLLAYLAVLFSLGLWDNILSVSGVVVLMALLLLLFILWSFIESARSAESAEDISNIKPWFFPLMGFILALLFLAEYTAGLIGVVFIGYCLIFFPRGKLLIRTLGIAVLIFMLTISLWVWRNIEWTGHPLALAGQYLSMRAGDSTAEPDEIKIKFDHELPPLKIKKVINKGFKGIEVNLKDHIWKGGGYLFCAFFLTGCLYRFRQRRTNVMRWCAIITVFTLLLFQPFFSSGLTIRLPAYYVTPLIIVFGCGFFMILLESTKKRDRGEKLLVILLVLIFHSLPLVHNLSEPRRVPFKYPPYIPSIMVYTRTDLKVKFRPEYGFMADIPAGLAWYSQQKVWAKPSDYSGFVNVFLRQNIGGLLLSPAILDKPYFSKLLPADAELTGGVGETRHWGDVYRGLEQGKLPEYFPLQIPLRLAINMFVLINPLATQRFR